MQFFIILALLALSVGTGIAAPNPTSAVGTISTGSSATVSGSDFGTHELELSSAQQNIETGTTGQVFAQSGWGYEAGWDWAWPLYATDAAHSGTKSLKCSISRPDMVNCPFDRELPDPVYAGEKLYISYWVKYNGDDGGQWKMLKVQEIETVVTTAMEFGMGTWFDTQRLAGGSNSASTEYLLWPQATTYPQADNTWSRMEIEFTANTLGQSNGTFTIRRTTDTGTIYEESLSNFNSHLNADDYFQFVTWQNYDGEGIDSAEIHFDDLYVQTGTVARVELCAGNTWTNRGKCEIQVPTSWSTSSIPITVNTGNFTSGSSAYLYVVDSSGTANTSGYQVTIGAGSQAGIGGRLSGSLSGGGVIR